VLACLGYGIPPMHYMLVTVSADATIPLAPHATYGTEELARGAAKALGGEGAAVCSPATGCWRWARIRRPPSTAVDRTIVMEEVAAAYYHALAVGPPNLLTSEQIAQVAAKISGYGQRKR
jgi:L-fuculose-phosphate aldolase